MTQKELRNIVLKKLYDFQIKEKNIPELTPDIFNNTEVSFNMNDLRNIFSQISELGYVDYIPTLQGIGAVKLNVNGIDYVEENLLT